MFTPSQLATFSMYAGATGALAQTFGSYIAASNAQDVARANARLAEYAARDALDRGAREEQALRYKFAALKGTQRARMAANGIDVNADGTALDILVGTDLMAETDAAAIRTNAKRQAWAHRAQKAQYNAEARASNPWLAATGSLLEGAGSVAARWYDFGESGVWDQGGGSIWGSGWRKSGGTT